MRRARVQKLDIAPGRRVLVVSDIHSNLAFLQALLERAHFCDSDLLILLGDFVEKRVGGLETLRYVMRLSEQGNVIPVCGNCDDLAVSFVDESPDVDAGFFDWYLDRWREQCLLVEMGNVAGVTVRDSGDQAALRTALKAQFAPELDFLRSLPTILINDRFLFVHGGVPREHHLEDLDAWACMKNDHFLTQAQAFQRWCVVGHWPVMLYDANIPAVQPIVDWERHIISIDGGCSLKLDGQLNALIIPGDGTGQFSCVAYDGLPLVVAQDAQAPSTDSINVRWGRNQLQVLQEGGEFCRCLHLESGRELDILTDFLYRRDGILRCEDSTDYCLPVSPGDVLSAVRETSKGLLAKKGGVIGWYRGRWSRAPGHLAQKIAEMPLKTWKTP